MRSILLNGVTVTGASSALRAGNGKETHTLQTVFTNSGGSVTALVVALEMSLDNSNWSAVFTHTFTAAELSAKFAQFSVTGITTRYTRANITTLTETGTTAVYVYYE